MNSDTVFSLLKLEAWHSSKSTTRMSRRVSVLKLLAWPPVPGTRGPSRKLASSSASRWSAGLAPDPVALATVPLLPPGGASTPLVPILNPSCCLELFTVKLFTAHHHFARCCGCAPLRLHPHYPLLLLSHPDIMSVKSEIEKLLLNIGIDRTFCFYRTSVTYIIKSKIKDDFQKFLVLKCLCKYVECKTLNNSALCNSSPVNMVITLRSYWRLLQTFDGRKIKSWVVEMLTHKIAGKSMQLCTQGKKVQELTCWK